jgi:hypothetical protein
MWKVTEKQTEQTRLAESGMGGQKVWSKRRAATKFLEYPHALAFALSMPAYATMRRPTRQACGRS